MCGAGVTSAECTGMQETATHVHRQLQSDCQRAQKLSNNTSAVAPAQKRLL